MKTYAPDEVIQHIETWTRYELTAINREIEGGDLAGVLLNRFKPLCDLATPLAQRPIGDAAASKLMQTLPFGVSSLERHMQWSGNEPGAGVAALGLADLLLHLGLRNDQPPRDTYRTYWLDNKGEAPLTFTGSYQEVLFNRVVNDTQDRHAASAAALFPICSGEVPFGSNEAVDAMELAILNHEQLATEFKALMQPAPDRPDEWALTKKFFALTLRTYLSKYPIAGTAWGGPNAANIPGQALCDFAIGTVDGAYRTIVRDRFPLLHADDRLVIDRAMDQPSLLDRVLAEISLEAWELTGIPEGDLVPRFLARRELMPALMAFTDLVKSAANLSAIHFALIHNYLRQMAAETPLEIRERLPVPLDHGTGDMAHDGTWRIMQMRRNHPIAQRIVTAIRAAA